MLSLLPNYNPSIQFRYKLKETNKQSNKQKNPSSFCRCVYTKVDYKNNSNINDDDNNDNIIIINKKKKNNNNK